VSQIRVIVAVAVLAMPQLADASGASCAELSKMVRMAGELRDQGVPRSQMERRMKRDLKSDPDQRAIALKVIDVAFDLPQHSPDALASLMMQTCLKQPR
jgi:hypothetical protein